MNFSSLGSVYSKEKPKYLDMALRSLNEQTHKANEIVLVHDGLLTLGLYHCLEKWRKILPLKEIKIKQHSGLASALNIGLRECSYELIARFDTDDINRPNRFETQINFFRKNPQVSVLSSYINEFSKMPNDLGQFKKVPTSHQDILYYAKTRSPMNHPSIMFKKNSILSVGGYPEDIPFMEDYGLWIKMLNTGRIFANISKVLVDCRMGNTLVNRRKGRVYLGSEVKIYKMKKDYKWNYGIHGFGIFALRYLSRILPSRLLMLVYKILRLR